MGGTIGAATAKTILVAEDDVLTRLDLSESLRAAGYAVIEAGSGDEAAAVLQSGVPVDLLLTDIQMPGRLDGIALARLALQRWPGLKVAIASANTVPADLIDKLHALFLKPYASLRVVERVDALLGGSLAADPETEIA